MRHGFTVPELLLVLCLMALLFLAVLPRIGRWQDTVTNDRAARRVATAYGRARLLAVTRGQEVTLIITAESLTVRISADPAAPALWFAPGPAADSSQLVGPSVRRARFAATGLGWGVPNTTVALRRGTATRSVVVSRLGRVRLRVP